MTAVPLRGSKTMNAKLSCLTLAIAFITVAAGSALAGGDVIYQGVKDPGAAIPVPAPIPVIVYEPEYYVRFDVGASWLANGSIEEYGAGTAMADIDDVEAIEFGSIGAGRYVTPSIRVELAVDLMTKAVLDRGPGTVKFEQDIGMLNAYYDFRNGSPFTPYIGGGIGVTYRQLSLATDLDPGTPRTEKQWDFVAAATAGVSYDITDDVVWDTSYRYLWQSGEVGVSAPTLSGTSRVEIKDVGQHQLRTGIRLNLN